MGALLPIAKFIECVTEVRDSWTKHQGAHFMVNIICVILNNRLSNLCRNLVLLNRILHGFVILIPSTAVGCFSKQSFVTPQVNQREEKKANITSKLFIPHQGNCWNYTVPMLSSLQAVRPCCKFFMISLPYWEYVHLAV